VLISGPMAVGKSSVAKVLINEHGLAPVRSGRYLAKLAVDRGIQGDRTTLQSLGDQLDVETDYRWIVDPVTTDALVESPEKHRWLIDAVRKRRQVEHFRNTMPHVVHVHLFASESVLKSRYESRARDAGRRSDGTLYEDAIRHPNEVAARSLIELADHTIDMGAVQAKDAALQIVELFCE
jgi:gluconate kinase